MMEYIEISAKNLNDAITKACIELSVSSDNLDYKVISEGSSGFLGIGSKPAIIKARKMVVSETSDINIEKVFEPVKTKKDFAKKEEKKQAEVKPAKEVKPVKEMKAAKEVKPAKEE